MIANQSVYLAGAIDRCPDAGRGWRQSIGEWLRQRGCKVFDPTHKVEWAGFDETAETIAARHAAKQRGDFDAVATEMQEVQRVDLWAVRQSDSLIVYIDPTVHACGTYAELFLANDLRKPIYINVKGGKEFCPDWLLGCIPHKQIFGSWEAMQKFLEN